MPSKITIGLAKKVGLPNYGSLGASCHVEVPAGDDPLESPEGFEKRVRRAFSACLKAVEEQLAQQSSAIEQHVTRVDREPAAPPRQIGGAQGSARRATPSQVRAIWGLAVGRRMDLAAFLGERHEVERPEELTVRSASAVIDQLREPSAAVSRR